jgi:DNA-binding MarR family transcriptional regulator
VETQEGKRKILEVLGKIGRLARAHACKLSQDYGLTPTQLMILKLIWENEKITLTDIAKEMSMSNSTASGVVDRMERPGLLERERSSEDRRVVYFRLTEKTKQYAEKLEKNKNSFYSAVLTGMSDQDEKEIRTALEKLYQILSRHQS